MTRNSFSFFSGSLLTCFVILGCSSDSSRQAPGQPHSLDAFMADRPQAGELLRKHPALEQWLRNEWSRPSGGYRIQWSNEKPPYGLSAGTGIATEDRLALIRISENYAPADQLIALCFETCNAQAHSRFEALYSKAAAGRISRAAFVEAVGEVEYGTVLRVKDCVARLLPLPSDEFSSSKLYRDLLEAPVEFAAYKEWSRSHSENYRISEDVAGREYENLRKGSSKQ